MLLVPSLQANWPPRFAQPARYIQTTDLDSANAARDPAAAFGFDDVQGLFPGDPLPARGCWLAVALDELLLDAHGRREYLAWLEAQPLRMPSVVLSRDFLVDPLTVVRPSLMLAPRLDDDVLRALPDGHLTLASCTNERRKAA